jgi:hypothetical protein
MNKDNYKIFSPPKIKFEGKKGNLNNIPSLTLPPPVILVK